MSLSLSCFVSVSYYPIHLEPFIFSSDLLTMGIACGLIKVSLYKESLIIILSRLRLFKRHIKIQQVGTFYAYTMAMTSELEFIPKHVTAFPRTATPLQTAFGQRHIRA